ncbi:MAG: ribosome silencing factor [Paludibacteraceae bacterium]|nr:ribosome silencing factor [Paludibacteraceae bacterium]MBR1786211.1 ribosome silencing factor [Paludibacteraceae bacterium]
MKLNDKIVEAIQNKKGHRIVVMDMRKLSPKPCDWFVVAEGGSNTQVTAIADEVEDFVRTETKEKPIAIIGRDNAEWIALDYGETMVHIFQREAREFYALEQLWGDAKITEVPEV